MQKKYRSINSILKQDNNKKNYCQNTYVKYKNTLPIMRIKTKMV
ncbi:hypothetical protein BGAFAR04_0455 [Borreliella garinii Far04]|nr:hypothetical protein BGAFAR04_0455 [Borreliella garinii Far04]